MTKNPFIPILIAILVIGIVVLFPGPVKINVPENTTTNEAAPLFIQDEITLLQADDTLNLNVELATEKPAWLKGMMDRENWGNSEGMLFVFPTEETRSFWMKNTLLPMDIIFFDGMGQVTNIVKDTTPLSEEHIPSLLPTQYVLEVPAGTVDKLMITDQLVLDTQSIEGSM